MLSHPPRTSPPGQFKPRRAEHVGWRPTLRDFSPVRKFHSTFLPEFRGEADLPPPQALPGNAHGEALPRAHWARPVRSVREAEPPRSACPDRAREREGPSLATFRGEADLSFRDQPRPAGRRRPAQPPCVLSSNRRMHTSHHPRTLRINSLGRRGSLRGALSNHRFPIQRP